MKLNKSFMGQRALETAWSLLFVSFTISVRDVLQMRKAAKDKGPEMAYFYLLYLVIFHNFRNWQYRKSDDNGKGHTAYNTH